MLDEMLLAGELQEPSKKVRVGTTTISHAHLFRDTKERVSTHAVATACNAKAKHTEMCTSRHMPHSARPY